MTDAVVCGADRISYAQLDERCRRVGGLIADRLDTAPGDRVAVLAENSVAFLDLYLGVPAHGRVVVPLNTRWAEPELHYALRDAEAWVLFTDRNPGPLVADVDVVVRTDLEYEPFLAAARSRPYDRPLPDDIAGLFYTGGTTGAAKGVMLTHRNLTANAQAMRTLAPLTADDVFLVMAPMHHAAGTTSVRYSVEAGARQVLLPFEPQAVLDVLEDEQVTHTLAVPTMLVALCDEQERHPRDVSSLRVLMHGAAPITPALVDRARAAFPNAEMVELYGTTETSPIVTARGRPVGCEVALTDEGEVCVRGDNVMAGYWRKPVESFAALEGGWYRTGDLGRLEDGTLHILDRKSDIIITGGENVYPTEVEAALASHPAVVEAAVYGVPDEQWGECVHAAVVARSPVTVPALIAHCRTQIAGYKTPRAVTFVDALPKSGAGKVLRRALR